MTNSDERLEVMLEGYVGACLDVFGEQRVQCILVHGSSVKGGAIPGFSDVDLQVFLAPDCFQRGEVLHDELAFAIQERTGDLPWHEAGFSSYQAFFRNIDVRDGWWTVPGSCRVLYGKLPAGVEPSAARIRESAVTYLRDELPALIDIDVAAFADAQDPTLRRRLRLLGTRLTPAVYALVARGATAPAAVWAQTKAQTVARLGALYPGQEGPALAQRFYEDATRLYGGKFDADLARDAFRTGVRFLRWAVEAGATDPPPPFQGDTPTEGVI